MNNALIWSSNTISLSSSDNKWLAKNLIIGSLALLRLYDCYNYEVSKNHYQNHLRKRCGNRRRQQVTDNQYVPTYEFDQAIGPLTCESAISELVRRIMAKKGFVISVFYVNTYKYVVVIISFPAAYNTFLLAKTYWQYYQKKVEGCCHQKGGLVGMRQKKLELPPKKEEISFAPIFPPLVNTVQTRSIRHSFVCKS